MRKLNSCIEDCNNDPEHIHPLLSSSLKGRTADAAFCVIFERVRPAIRAPLVLAGLLAMLCAPAQSAPLDLDPKMACMALADAGLPGRGGYRGNPGEAFRCDSRRKPIMAGDVARDEIRFSALGNERTVEEFLLVLSVRSPGGIQKAHRTLSEYADALTRKILQVPLPEEVNDGIMSGLNGSWERDGRLFDLRRTTVGEGLYDLRLRIR